MRSFALVALAAVASAQEVVFLNENNARTVGVEVQPATAVLSLSTLGVRWETKMYQKTSVSNIDLIDGLVSIDLNRYTTALKDSDSSGAIVQGSGASFTLTDDPKMTGKYYENQFCVTDNSCSTFTYFISDVDDTLLTGYNYLGLAPNMLGADPNKSFLIQYGAAQTDLDSTFALGYRAVADNETAAP